MSNSDKNILLDTRFMSIVLDTRTNSHLYLGTGGDVVLEEDDGVNFVGLNEGYDVGAGAVITDAYNQELRRSVSGRRRKHKCYSSGEI